MVNRKRNSVINIRVTPQEKRRIELYAGKCRLSVSEYIRQLANGYAPQELPAELIEDLHRMALRARDFKQREFQLTVEAKLNELIAASFAGRQEGPEHGNH